MMVGFRFAWVCVLFATSGTFAKQCDFRVDVSPATYTEGGCFTIEGSPTDAAEIQEDYKSWADAETACQAKGGYLARFSIPEWQAFEAYEEAASLAETYDYFRFWTGGNREDGTHDWHYEDGGEDMGLGPLNLGWRLPGEGNCLLVLPNRQKPLFAQDCEQLRPNVCEYDLCDFEAENSCFTVEGSPTDAAEIQDDYKSWADAETDCQANGGYLARLSIPEWQAFEAYEDGAEDMGLGPLNLGWRLPGEGNCLLVLPNRQKPLFAQDCEQLRPYVCEYERN